VNIITILLIGSKPVCINNLVVSRSKTLYLTRHPA